MALDREAVQAALFARLISSSPGLGSSIKFSSRAFLSFDDIAGPQTPALVLVAEKATAHGDLSHPQLWTMTSLLILYVQTNGKAPVPETVLFGLIKQVETALQHQNGEATFDDWSTTLGGLVQYARLVDHEIHPGAGSNKAIAMLTLEMLALE